MIHFQSVTMHFQLIMCRFVLSQVISGNVYIFVIGNMQNFTSQIFGVVGHLAENLDFISPLEFDVQQILITKPENSSSTQGFKMLSESGKSDTWSSSGNDSKI